MKKISKHLLLFLMSALFMIACASEEKKPAEQQNAEASDTFTAPSSQFDSKEACLAAYVDVSNLIEKSGITENQRKLFAAMATKNIDDKFAQQYVYNSIVNLDNSGIKFSKPIYMTANMGLVEETPTYELILVAEVSNIDTLDTLAKSAGIDVNTDKDGVRYTYLQDNDLYLTAGYNNDYLTIVATNGGYDYSYNLFINALENANVDLSIFNNRDIALYANFERIYDTMLAFNNQFKANDYGKEFIPAETQMMIAEYLNNFEDLKMVTGLTFANGRIVLDAQFTGISDIFDPFNIFKASNNANLKYIPNYALGFANLSIDGDKMAEIINTVLTREVKANLAYNFGIPVNEFTTYVTIATDIIKSINGDMTIALNNFDYSTVTMYDYEYDEYYTTETVKDIDAALIVNTDSNYIIENLKLIPSNVLPLKERVKDSLYTAYFDGNEINFGQKDSTFFVGVNTLCDNDTRQNAESKWASEFNGSLAYLVVDVQNILNSNLGNLLRKEVYNDIELREVFNMLNLVDSAWIVSKDANNTELVLSFTDKNRNALEQIVSYVMGRMQNEF